MYLVQKIFRRILQRPHYKRFVIMTKTLNGQLPTYQARIRLNLERLSLDAQEIQTRLAHLPAKHRPDIERRIERGHCCWVAKHKGQIVYATWVALGTCYSYGLDREFELAQDEAYSYGSYTLPEFRGKEIHPATRCQVLQSLTAQGYKRAFSFIDPENHAAMRMPEKLGYAKVGTTGFIELFGLRWYFHRDKGAFGALKNRNYWRKV